MRGHQSCETGKDDIDSLWLSVRRVERSSSHADLFEHHHGARATARCIIYIEQIRSVAESTSRSMSLTLYVQRTPPLSYTQ